MTIRLATISLEGRSTAVIEDTGRLFPVEALAEAAGLEGAPSSMVDVFTDWSRWSRDLGALVDAVGNLPAGSAIDPGNAIFEAPLQFPGKVLCAGANYYDHIEEMGIADTRKEAQRLFFFMKPPRNAIVGPGKTVRMPRRTKMLDWEVELAVVIGKTTKDVAEENALEAVAAATVAIDLSARDMNKAPDAFYKLDWLAGKGNDTCCPMGPYLVPADQLENLQDLELRLAVNGETKQHARTSGMIFSIAEQISIASSIMTLDPGDVLLTGTPAGVGMPKGTFLDIGDIVEAEIEGIGTLTVEIGA